MLVNLCLQTLGVRKYVFGVDFLRRFWVCFTSIVLAVFLPGCFLLPEEPVIPELPVVTAYESEEFKLAEAVKSDIELIETLTCSYVSTREQNLIFTETGSLYGAIYVEVGDRVKAGELIAELDMSEIDEETETIGEQLAVSKRDLEFSEQDLELAERIVALGGQDDTETYKEEITELTDGIYVLELRLSELDRQREERRLYAGIDGTVTYVKTVGSESLTMGGSTIVTISDRESSIFEARTQYYELLREGEIVEINVGSSVYSAVVTSPEAIGYKESEPDKDGAVPVYLSLLDEEDISTGIKGTLDLLVDRRENVITLPRKAIVSAGGQSMVYYQDSDGLRSIKEVQVGLQTKDTVEITGGLSEGDLVILS